MGRTNGKMLKKIICPCCGFAFDAGYDEFVKKFEPKKTTDDCYTPPVVYDAVADYVAEKYGLSRGDFVRPFYPGGNYQKEDYPDGCVVVDNPPFSILSEIVKFYNGNGIKFFLFAPTLTLFSSSSSSCACICLAISVIYENKANVNTSFLTNLEPVCIRSDPGLYKRLDGAVKAYTKELTKELPKYTYPDYVATSAKIGWFSKYGVDFCAYADEIERISALDEQRKHGKAIFGSGYLLSEKAAAEKAAAEKAAATAWKLSEREMEIVKRLGKSHEKEIMEGEN